MLMLSMASNIDCTGGALDVCEGWFELLPLGRDAGVGVGRDAGGGVGRDVGGGVGRLWLD